jgi:outer membrane protein
LQKFKQVHPENYFLLIVAYMKKLAFLLFLSSTVLAQETLTLQQVIQIALENNYAIRIARNNQRIAENEVTRGNAGMLPVISAGGQAGNTYFLQNQQKRFLTARSGGDSTVISSYDSKTNTAVTGNITLNWLVFDGFAMFATYERLAELRAAGRENTQVTIENTVASVSSAYFTVIEQKNRIQVTQDAVRISQERLRLAKNRYEIGTGPRQDFLSAQVDYNADQSALILQEQQYRNAKISLNQLLIRPPVTDFTAADTLLVNEKLNLEELRQEVSQKNPALLVAQYQKNAAYQAGTGFAVPKRGDFYRFCGKFQPEPGSYFSERIPECRTELRHFCQRPDF